MRRRAAALLLVVPVLVALWAAPAAAQDAPVHPLPLAGGWAAPGRYVVRFDPSVGAGQVRSSLDRLRPSGYSWAAPSTYLVAFADHDATAEVVRLAQLRDVAGVESAEPQWISPPGQPWHAAVAPDRLDLRGTEYATQFDGGATSTVTTSLGPPRGVAREPSPPADDRDAPWWALSLPLAVLAGGVTLELRRRARDGHCADEVSGDIGNMDMDGRPQ